MSLTDELKDALERALWSAGQQLVSVLIVAGAMVLTAAGLPWKIALATSAGAFVVSIVLSIAQFSLGARVLPLWANIGVRVVKTFAASLGGTFGGSVLNVLTFHWTTALNVAVLATILALAKSVLSMRNPIPAATRRPGRAAVQPNA